jgi:hypothetical protein
MRKTTLILVSLIIISCKSEKEKQEEVFELKADSLTSVALLRIDSSYYKANFDSIKKIYLTNNDIKTKLEYAIALNKYSIELKAKRDSISKKINAETEAQEEKKIALEEAKWFKTKAGKIQKKHPNWSREDCKNIVDRKVWIGMSIDMLKYMRGNPNHANPSDYGNGVQWQWCWDDFTPSCFYGENDGIVTSYN